MASLKIDVHTPAGKKDGSVELPAHLFDVEPNIALNYTVEGFKITPKLYYDFVLRGPTAEVTGTYAIPLKDMGTELDFTGQFGGLTITSIDGLTVSVASILDGDTGAGDFDENNLTLALDGIDTGLVLNGLAAGSETTAPASAEAGEALLAGLDGEPRRSSVE